MAHQKQWMEAFAHGLEQHREQWFWGDPNDPEPCDLAVVWGMRTEKVIEAQKKASKPYLVLERGFMGDREKWCSAGYNGLCGQARWPDVDDPQRFAEHFEPLWKEPSPLGDYALVIGQVPGDAAVDTNLQDWFADVEDELYFKPKPTYFRPHPLAPNLKSPWPVLDKDLQESIDNAFIVITYSSTVGIQARLSGKITTADGPTSMLNLWNNLSRRQWAERLAWCQWSETEMANGYAWSVLKNDSILSR